MNKNINTKEVNRRSEILLLALQLLWEEPEKTMTTTGFQELLKGIPSIPTILTSLNHNGLTESISRGRSKGLLKYVGVEPNPVIAKKCVEYAVERARNWSAKNKAVQRSNKTMTVQEAAATIVKPGPLHYNQFLKELSILKERYKLTVPSAEIEINVKVSSVANV